MQHIFSLVRAGQALLAALLTLGLGHAQAQCTDLFFSEYVEGSSNNKAIEVYNPTSSTVNLANYVIYRYNNGAAIPSDSLHMVGTLAPGAVYVAGNPTAIAAILSVSDTLHTITFYNGDDAMSLKNKVTGVVLDIIGIIGNDPGTNWAVGTGATSEYSLVRMLGIQGGTTNWTTSVAQWDVYPQNTTTYIGNHSMTPCGATNPIVSLSVSANAGTEAGTTAITVTATASAAVTSSQTVDLTVTGTSITAGDYTLGNTTLTLLSGATTATTTFTIINDTDLEGTETAVLTLSNPSAGILLGTTTQSIAIADDDNTLVISEIHPTGSSTTTYVADWFEVTNTGTAAVDITGWKIDDASNSFAAAAPLAGVTSIAPGQSIIFMEGTGVNNALFTAAWFGTNIPAGFTIGSYTASGISLSSGGDAVNLFNALGNPVTGVTFGAATAGTTFDNVANLTAVSQLSVVGVNGAFVSVTGSETGSPGTTVNPPPATVTLSVSANAGTEAGTTAITVTATAGNAVNGNQTVTLAVTGTSITAGDYSLSNATITILNGATTGSETFTIVNDLEVEGTETATLTISSPSAGLVLGTTVSQNVAITDNDNTLVITEIHPTGSSASYTGDWFEVTNTGTVAANITGWKIDDSSNSFAAAAPLAGVTTIAPGQSVIFMEGTGLNNSLFTTAWFGSNVPAGFTIGSYTASGIGLSSGGDAVNLFNATGGAITGVTFGAATTGTTFDNVANVTAVSQLSVVGVNGAFLSSTGNETGSPGTIVNSSTTPALVNVSVSANAGTESGATVITVTATAGQAVSSNQTVDLLVSGSGITTGDYSLSSTTITIPAGTTTGSVTFTVTDDALIEGAETATLTLSNPSAGLVLGTTISQAIALTDNDAAGITVTQSAGTTTATEGGATDTYTLVLNAQPTADVTITLNPGAQLSLSATTFTFTTANWSVPQTVTVTALNDLVVEGNHNGTISHTVASADAAYNSLSVADVTVAITDNDVVPVTLSLSAHAGSEASATAITVYAITPVNMPSAQTIALTFSGAGINPGDYYAPTTITIPAGQDTGMATLVIADDAVQEGAETLTVTLGSPSALLVLGTTISDTVVITNNDCSFMNRISGFTSTNGAEIAAFDPASNSLYTVAGSVIEQFTMNSTGTLTLVGALPLGFTPVAGFKAAPNSVSVKNGILATAYAIVDTTTLAQARGIVGFYTAATGAFLDTALVGYLPDMVTLTPDGTKVMTANEGEPNSYGQATSFDPEGSVSIINIAGGVVGAPVQTATFTGYNSQLASLQAAGVRIYGPGATVAQDLEPEYIAFSADGLTAMVTLQENNALANIDIATATVTSIIPLGLKDHSLPGNGLDASDRDLTSSTGKINIQNWPVFGLYQPDAIASYTVGGNTYYVMANEGDTRAWTGFNEEVRLGATPYVLDPTAFPNAATLKLNANLGRLQVTNATGDLDNDGDFDQIFTNGGRSFSIRNSAGALVFDSGDQLEQITAAKAPILFNSEGVLGGFDSRSGKKGPEPEGIAIGSINGKTYAFVGMERVGDLIVYDITDPAAPVFVQYFNTPEDQSPEGVLFVSAANSPTGKPLVISTHEVSNTVAVYEVNMPFVNVQETSGLVANDRILCPGATATLIASPGTSFAWSNGVTTNPNTVTTAGTYSVNITDANGCIRTAQATVSYTSPIVATVLADSAIACFGDSTSATVTVTSGVAPFSYLWSNGDTTATADSLESGIYGLIVEDDSACITSITLTEPTALAAALDSLNDVTCFGAANGAIYVTASGGTAPYTYTWSNSSTDEDADSLAGGSYTGIITDANGCVLTTSAIAVAEPALLDAVADSITDATCAGFSNGGVALTVSGGIMPYSYAWSNGDTTEDLTGLVAATYTGTITDANGCVLTATVIVEEPTALTIATDSVNNVKCFGQANGSIFLTPAGGTAPYAFLWSNQATTEDLTGLAAGQYIGTATDANGCISTDMVAVTEPLALTATTFVVANACKEGTTGSIALTPKGGTPAYQVLWNTGATGNVLATLGAGTYTATLTDANSCTTTIQKTVTNIDSLPTAAGTGAITGSGLVAFAQTSSVNALSVKWLFGDGTSSFQKSPVHTYTANGTYTVTLVASNFCGSDTITFPVTLTNVGIAENLSSALSLYPNPTEGAFSLAFDGVSLSDAVLELYSMDGKLVVTESLGTVNGSDVRSITLDRSAVATGVYTVRVCSAEGVMVKRLVIR